MPGHRKSLALVIQRFGDDINGGAEAHARMLAERLAAHHDIEVLTSCARDYSDWAPAYPPGVSVVAGLPVMRFAHPQRNDIGRARVPLRHKARFFLRRLLALRAKPLVSRPRGEPTFDGEDYLRRQGPHCPGLIEHLMRSHDRYDVVIFFTALYEPSACGLRHWGRRSILVPLLHDEKPMYLPLFHTVFRAAGALLFNTESERALAQRLYGIDTHGMPIAGLGMELQAPEPRALSEALARHGLRGGYLVYVGRIEKAKGCDELITAFLSHLHAHPDAQLVLVGKAMMTVPSHPRIVGTGFVSDADRDALIAGAAALVVPSRYESLSMVLLEAMLLQVPVIANAGCQVLADHVLHSGAGIAYRGRRGLVRALAQVAAATPAERQQWGQRGEAYVRSRYHWPRVLQLFNDAIERVCQEPGPSV